MNQPSDLMKLYSTRILALAAEIPHTGRLDAPDASLRKRAPLCGSTVTVDICVQDGKVTQYAQDVKACALGQASASIFGENVIGLTLEQIQTGRDALLDMLKNNGPVPGAPFDALEVLQPAADFKNRHASILLAWDATVEAMQSL
jgi:NifU-like protein involved in Fe-S cluster formation